MKDGGPAFPGSQATDVSGMSLRDYFAAAALQGYRAMSRDREENVAKLAYKDADAMLAERDK